MVTRRLILVLSASILAHACSFQHNDVAGPTPVTPSSQACTGPPNTAGFVGWTTADVAAGSLRITWEPATGATTAYIVELGTTIGGSEVGIVEVGGDARSYTFFRLAPGDYHGRVRARNECGVSAPSNEANPRVR